MNTPFVFPFHHLADVVLNTRKPDFELILCFLEPPAPAEREAVHQALLPVLPDLQERDWAWNGELAKCRPHDYVYRCGLEEHCTVTDPERRAWLQARYGLAADAPEHLWQQAECAARLAEALEGLHARLPLRFALRKHCSRVAGASAWQHASADRVTKLLPFFDRFRRVPIDLESNRPHPLLVLVRLLELSLDKGRMKALAEPQRGTILGLLMDCLGADEEGLWDQDLVEVAFRLYPAREIEILANCPPRFLAQRRRDEELLAVWKAHTSGCFELPARPLKLKPATRAWLMAEPAPKAEVPAKAPAQAVPEAPAAGLHTDGRLPAAGFPFIGSGDAEYYGDHVDVDVVFSRVPTEAERQAIEARIPALLSSRVWKGDTLDLGSGEGARYLIARAYGADGQVWFRPQGSEPRLLSFEDYLHDDYVEGVASPEHLAAFNREIETFLKAAHGLLPIRLAYRANPDGPNPFRHDAWHAESCEYLARHISDWEAEKAQGRLSPGLRVLAFALGDVEARIPPEGYHRSGWLEKHRDWFEPLTWSFAWSRQVMEEGWGTPEGWLLGALKAGNLDRAQEVHQAHPEARAAMYEAIWPLFHDSKEGGCAVMRFIDRLEPSKDAQRLADYVYDAWKEAEDFVDLPQGLLQGLVDRWQPLLLGTPLERRTESDLLEAMQGKQFAKARRIAYLGVTLGSTFSSVFANALFVAQEDNTGLPVDRALDEHLLRHALPQGRHNPTVFVNAACVYVELGEPNSAAEMLGMAIRAGREESVRKLFDEPMFAATREDPRFRTPWQDAGALPRTEPWTPADLDRRFTHEFTGRYAHFVEVRPGLSLMLYSDASLSVLGPAVAEVLEAFLAFMPPKTLGSYWNRKGEYGPMASARPLATTLKGLRDLAALQPGREQSFDFSFSEGTDARVVGRWGIHFKGLEPGPHQKHFPDATSWLVLEYPVDLLEQVGGERLEAFFREVAGKVPFVSGNAGYAFHGHPISGNGPAKYVNRHLMRFLGFDPSYKGASEEMKGRSPSAHWINFLGTALADQLGGFDALRAHLPEAVALTALPTGLMIRGTERPPVGDVLHGARDIGHLPDVARLLKPLRVHLSALGNKEVDGEAWLGRFDELESRTERPSLCP